jgi:hypothetical protein
MAIQPAEDATPVERTNIDSMTDREILVEILTHMRDVEDAIEALSESPMVAAIMSGGNPLMAMMGR